MSYFQYQYLSGVTLFNGDNNYITAQSDNIQSYEDFYYFNSLRRTNSAFTFNYKVANNFQLPHPNGFLILDPVPYYTDFENEISVVSQFNHNSGSYDRGFIQMYEWYNNRIQSTHYHPFFLILNGSENKEVGVFNYTDYELKASSSKFLTDFQGTRLATINSYLVLSMLNGKNYPDLGGLVGSVGLNVENEFILLEVVFNSNFTTSGGNCRRLRLKITNPDYGDYTKSRIDINLKKILEETTTLTDMYSGGTWWHVSGDSITTSEDILGSKIKYLTVWSEKSDGTQTSRKYEWEFTHDCRWGYEQYHLLWLNRFGGIESYTFWGSLNTEYQVEHETRPNNNLSINLTTGYINRNYTDPQEINYQTRVSNEFQLATGLVPTELGLLFYDLLRSNYILWADTSGDIPLICLTRNLKVSNSQIKVLSNFTFNFKRNIREQNQNF